MNGRDEASASDRTRLIRPPRPNPLLRVPGWAKPSRPGFARCLGLGFADPTFARCGSLRPLRGLCDCAFIGTRPGKARPTRLRSAVPHCVPARALRALAGFAAAGIGPTLLRSLPRARLRRPYVRSLRVAPASTRPPRLCVHRYPAGQSPADQATFGGASLRACESTTRSRRLCGHRYPAGQSPADPASLAASGRRSGRRLGVVQASSWGVASWGWRRLSSTRMRLQLVQNSKVSPRIRVMTSWGRSFI